MPRHWLKLADLYRHNHENHKAYICILNAKTFSASQFLDSTQDYLDKFCSEFSEFNRLGVAGGGGGGHRAGDRESKAVAGQDENEDFTDLGKTAHFYDIDRKAGINFVIIEAAADIFLYLPKQVFFVLRNC